MAESQTMWSIDATLTIDEATIAALEERLGLTVGRVDPAEHTIAHRVLDFLGGDGTVLWLVRTERPGEFRFTLKSSADFADSEAARLKRDVEDFMAELVRSPARIGIPERLDAIGGRRPIDRGTIEFASAAGPVEFLVAAGGASSSQAAEFPLGDNREANLTLRGRVLSAAIYLESEPLGAVALEIETASSHLTMPLQFDADEGLYGELLLPDDEPPVVVRFIATDE